MASPAMRAMAEVHRAAELEHVRNSVILCKRTQPSLRYEVCPPSTTQPLFVVFHATVHTADGCGAEQEWLKVELPHDHKNEYVSKCRRNEMWHAIWDEIMRNPHSTASPRPSTPHAPACKIPPSPHF